MIGMNTSYWEECSPFEDVETNSYRCARCKGTVHFDVGGPERHGYAYCPFCGAKMKARNGKRMSGLITGIAKGSPALGISTERIQKRTDEI